MKVLYNIFLFLFVSCLCFSQTKGRITYRIITEPLTYQEDNPQRKIFVEFMTHMSKIRDSIALNLDFNKHESIFYADEDTDIGLSNVKGYNSILSSLHRFYRNDSTGVSIERIDSDKIFLVNSKINDIKWAITNEKKTIGDYDCIKANAVISGHTVTRGVYNKTIEAWFCPSIPLKLGPKNYGGLPGLIMELKDGRFTYYVKSMNLNPNFEIEVEKPKKGKSISKDDYYALQPKITRENIKEYIGN
jgi:GLPGLI family protein